MTPRLFKQIDVFTGVPYLGNPLAVVLDGSGLDDAAMQRFARWTNLSETSFLLPPTDASADYRVRIFTPGSELPFAGHPTLGSCHAWLEAGGQPKNADLIVQECQLGLITIRREAGNDFGQRLAFGAPPLKRSLPDPAWLRQVREALGLQPEQVLAAQLLDNGPAWLGLLLDSVEAVLQLDPNHPVLEKLGANVGVAALYPPEDAPPLIARANREARAFGASFKPASRGGPELEVRAFAAGMGISEDPVTGSLNASLAQWLIADGRLPERYLALQGACVKRAGQVHVERDSQGQVWVGGESVTCIDGQVTLEATAP